MVCKVERLVLTTLNEDYHHHHYYFLIASAPHAVRCSVLLCLALQAKVTGILAANAGFMTTVTRGFTCPDIGINCGRYSRINHGTVGMMEPRYLLIVENVVSTILLLLQLVNSAFMQGCICHIFTGGRGGVRVSTGD